MLVIIIDKLKDINNQLILVCEMINDTKYIKYFIVENTQITY